MKSAGVWKKGDQDFEVRITDESIPEPGDDQVLIKVVVSGSNPKDWKAPFWMNAPGHQGDDIAGVVAKVGKNVYEFKPGDRVAAFHEMMAPAGSFAEYGLAWQHTTFHIPEGTSFEEAATIPLAAMTSALGLYRDLGLPQLITPATEPTPLVIYGGGTSVGAFAVQLARRSNIHPLVVVAGKSASFVEALLDKSKGDVIVDYRGGEEAVVSGIKNALKTVSTPLRHAFDGVSEKGSYQAIGKAFPDGKGRIATVLPGKQEEVPQGVEIIRTFVAQAHQDEANGKDFGHAYFRLFARGLAEGWFKPHPHQVVPGGLAGIEGALKDLQAGKASAVKYVFRIADTEGAGKEKL